MNRLVVAIAITLIAASSALAAPKRVSQDHAKLSESKALVLESESHDVYVAGRLIGRDPDPAIRQSLRSSYFANSGH